MDKALISLSFDDGRKDNILVFNELLKPKAIPMTLNVTTGFVDGTCPHENAPTDKPAISIDGIRELFKSDLVEIALHGNNHLNTAEDISDGREKLIEWLALPVDYSFGFASPGSKLSIAEFTQSNNPLFRDRIIYMRHSLRITDKHFLRTYSRKVARVWHNPMLFTVAYRNTIMKDCPDRVIYAVPVMKGTTVNQLVSLVNECIRKRGALTLMFHSIVNNIDSEDNWSWKKEDFQVLIQYMDQKRSEGTLDIVTTKDLFNAIK